MDCKNLLNSMDEALIYENYKAALNIIKARNPAFLAGKIDFSSLNKESHFSIIRHDVDFLLNPVLEMATLEKSLDIQATYFFLSNADKYNLISDEGLELISTLKKLGHSIGIHLTSKELTSESEVQGALEKEILFFEKFTNTTPECFSYHMPNPKILENKSDSYLGLSNYYSETLFNKFKYLSDSNGYWRHETLKSFMDKNCDENIYLLTHPVWWDHKPGTPKTRLKNALTSSDEHFTNWYKNVCEKYNRKFF